MTITKDPREFLTDVNTNKLIDELEDEVNEQYDADAVVGIKFLNYECSAHSDIIVYGTAVSIQEE